MSKEGESGIDTAIYSPLELQRLAQFQTLIHKSNEMGQRLKDGEKLSLIGHEATGKEVEIFPITGRMIGAMKDTALNMYSEYFSENEKLKDAALDIAAAERALRGEAEGITESQFDALWENGEDL